MYERLWYQTIMAGGSESKIPINNISKIMNEDVTNNILHYLDVDSIKNFSTSTESSDDFIVDKPGSVSMLQLCLELFQ